MKTDADIILVYTTWPDAETADTAAAESTTGPSSAAGRIRLTRKLSASAPYRQTNAPIASAAFAKISARRRSRGSPMDVKRSSRFDSAIRRFESASARNVSATSFFASTSACVGGAVGALAAPGPKPGGRSKPYGDPARRACLATEMKVQIQGVPGDFCSPSCSVASPCPEDPYRGATARGMCVLQTPGSDKPNRCASVCNPRDDAPNGGCPKGASCRPVAQVGICTYRGP